MTALIDAIAALSLWCSLFMAGLTDMAKSRDNNGF